MILKQEEIKYIFNPAVLLPGDILLMNTYEERLRTMMGCQYEHAAIYLGDAFLMEANGSHVLMSHIYSYAFKEENHACVLRLKHFLPNTLTDIARRARMQYGREYVNTTQFRYVRAFKNTDKKDDSNRSFCSRLVAQAYENENIHLLPNADFCEPDDFLKSSLLEEVKSAIVPFSDDMATVVMTNQESREKNEIDNPNGELFKALSELYNENIQDLSQALLSSSRKPEFDDKAIEIIKTSRMFKHMDDVNSEMPWLMNVDQFFSHFSDTKRAMHFLYSQMQHYDNTILPDYNELHLQMITLAYYRPECKVVVFLRDYIAQMVDEAITCRKQLETLFIETYTRYKDDFIVFVNKYGIYKDFEYKPPVTDISFILRDIMKAYSDANNSE